MHPRHPNTQGTFVYFFLLFLIFQFLSLYDVWVRRYTYLNLYKQDIYFIFIILWYLKWLKITMHLIHWNSGTITDISNMKTVYIWNFIKIYFFKFFIFLGVLSYGPPKENFEFLAVPDIFPKCHLQGFWCCWT